MSDGLMNIRRWRLSPWWILDYRIGKKFLQQKEKILPKLRSTFGLLEQSCSRHAELDKLTGGVYKEFT